MDVAYDAGLRLFLEPDGWVPADLRDAGVRDLDRMASRLSQLSGARQVQPAVGSSLLRPKCASMEA